MVQSRERVSDSSQGRLTSWRNDCMAPQRTVIVLPWDLAAPGTRARVETCLATGMREAQIRACVTILGADSLEEG